MSDRFEVSVAIGEQISLRRFKNIGVDLSFCYEHVGESKEVVGCSQRLFGWKPYDGTTPRTVSPRGQNSFWLRGIKNATLLDDWILYHTKVVGFGKLHLYTTRGNFDQALVPYIQAGLVEHFPDKADSPWFETQQYSQYFWENRIRSVRTYIIYSSDNFVHVSDCGKDAIVAGQRVSGRGG